MIALCINMENLMCQHRWLKQITIWSVDLLPSYIHQFHFKARPHWFSFTLCVTLTDITDRWIGGAAEVIFHKVIRNKDATVLRKCAVKIRGKRRVKECLSIQKQGAWDLFQRISRAALILIWQPPLMLFFFFSLRPSEREEGEACTSKRETHAESRWLYCGHALMYMHTQKTHACMQTAESGPTECLGHNSFPLTHCTAWAKTATRPTACQSHRAPMLP